MTKVHKIILLCIALGLVVALFGPFKSFGDAIKPGLGDLLNGMVAMLLLIGSAIVAIVSKKKQP